MSVRIRLKRTGRRNRPCHRLCAIDKHTRRDGRILENLGLYDPLAPRVEDQLRLDGERIAYWVSVGASMSEIAASLVKRAGIELPVKEKKPRVRTRKVSEAKAKARHARKAGLYKAKKERREAREAAKKAPAAEGGAE